MKIYTIQIDEDRIVQEIEETAKIAGVLPVDLIVAFVAKAVAPQSKTAQKFDRDLYQQP